VLTRTKNIITSYNITTVAISSFLSLISLGGIGAIYKLNTYIMVKIPCYKNEPDYTIKQSIFNILESYLPHLNLVIS
jgi:atypical protein kinase C zeta type